jgi:uncharacterized protein YbbC (DUF1343 family)
VIPLKNYDRDKIYELPIKPSPNLPNWQSIYLYPSLCLFEGTVVSIGRGTDTPFTVYGHPDFLIGSYVFTPRPMPGAMRPKLEGQICYGQNLIGYANHYQEADNHLNLAWLINAYEVLDISEDYFIPYFEKLAGTDKLRQQIMAGKNAEEIRESWQEDLEIFKSKRAKYLIYKDFNTQK